MEKFDLENFPVSESAKNMIVSVSDGFYDNSYVGKWLYEVMGQEYDTATVSQGNRYILISERHNLQI